MILETRERKCDVDLDLNCPYAINNILNSLTFLDDKLFLKSSKLNHCVMFV